MTTLADALTTLTALRPPGEALVRVRLNVREGPSPATTRIGRLEPGTLLQLDAMTTGSPFLDTDTWFRIQAPGQGWVWAGGLELRAAGGTVVPVASSPGTAPMQVNRRANGSILPLSNQELDRLYGRLNHEDAGGGRARIKTPGWVDSFIQPFAHPIFQDLDLRAPRFHVKALPYLQSAFDAIRAAGLGPLIISWDGSFVPRYKNWDARSGQLSSHSWGVAFDINQRFNGVRQVPALPGKPGDLRPLVPIFAAAGFAWGGHFSSPLDGMHFELACINP